MPAKQPKPQTKTSVKITLILREPAKSLCEELCREELRKPSAMAALLIQEGLIARGIMKKEDIIAY